jgi:hypothetical protein
VPSAQRASIRQGSSSKTAVDSRANIAVPLLSFSVAARDGAG